MAETASFAISCQSLNNNNYIIILYLYSASATFVCLQGPDGLLASYVQTKFFRLRPNISGQKFNCFSVLCPVPSYMQS